MAYLCGLTYDKRRTTVSGMRRLLLLVLFLAASAAPAQRADLHFDSVTVKPTDPAKEHLALYWRQPDGLKWDGVTLRGMIANAYGVSCIVKGQIEGGPDWMGSRAFDINAKVDTETIARWSKMTQAGGRRRAAQHDAVAACRSIPLEVPS